VVAVYPGEAHGLGRSVWCWRTVDGGQTWAGSRIVQALFDREGAADPLIGYGADGALIAVSMALPKNYIDTGTAERAGYTRLTSPTADEVIKHWEGQIRIKAYPGVDMICIARSEDHGERWASTIVPNSGAGDKTALAIDQYPNSPHRGNIYVAWSDGANKQLAFARSVNGGRTAERAIRIGGRNGFSLAQIAVGAEGSVHVLWNLPFFAEPAPEHPRATTSIFYARSEDGGATFSDPVVVAEHGGHDRIGLISMVAAPSGSILAAWPESETAARERGTQARMTIRWMKNENGKEWSAPQPLTEVPTDVSQGLPAVASTQDAWHVLSYDAGPTRTSVRIYTARHDGLKFHPTLELATRDFGLIDLNLQGNYQLHKAHDIAAVGDYVGLAGGNNQLAAAIVLPENDDWRSKLTAYAAIVPAP
jgi:hypothetical protein